MILVDTSVWIDHFRKKEATLVELLLVGQVMMHPWIMGELACGNLRDRKNILALLSALPKVHTATTDEALFFVEQHLLMGVVLVMLMCIY
jgi:Predicted nucleic acid-binding protein, contains PIN domain